MERFIRKKYQEKSLIDGKPEPPNRPTVSTGPSASDLRPPQPQTASKKHRIFGFGFRASKKDKNESQADGQYKITPIDYSPTSGRTRELTDRDMQLKLAQLQEMGFSDNEQNLDVLRKAAGDMEKTISILTRLGSSTTSSKPSTGSAALQGSSTKNAPVPTSSTSVSGDPRRQRDADSFEVSSDSTPVQNRQRTGPSSSSANPWHADMPSQQMTSLEQQFSSMNTAQSLFPHNTGPVQTQYPSAMRLQTMTPPVPSTHHHYTQMTLSTPTQASTNPFLSGTVSAQSNGNNPFMQQGGQFPSFAPPTNPFFQRAQLSPPYSSSSAGGLAAANPFDMSSEQSADQSQYYQQQGSSGLVSLFPPQTSVSQLQQTQPYSQAPQSTSSQFPNFNYGQSHATSPFQMQQQAVLPQSQDQQPPNALYTHEQQPQQPLAPQRTGRYTKTDIMALFNAPPPPNLPLAPISEPQENHNQSQSAQSPFSPSPNNPFGGISNSGAKRSVTSPATMSNMYSSGGGGSRNPFLSNNTSRQPSASSMSSSPFPNQAQTQLSGSGHYPGARHASNESMSVNNPALLDGRHSPDAFASLSSRYT